MDISTGQISALASLRLYFLCLGGVGLSEVDESGQLNSLNKWAEASQGPSLVQAQIVAVADSAEAQQLTSYVLVWDLAPYIDGDVVATLHSLASDQG